MSTTFEHWKIDNLKNHHLNAEVFGQLSVDADCGEFVESVKRDGILQPLVVVPDGPKVQAGTIIAGHRRLQAAAKAGLKEVPVIVRRDLKSQLDIDRVWFETNLNREMTNEQKARWYKKREAIESEAAKSRQSAAGGSAPVKFDASASGRAADIAAKDVGFSRNTAKAAAAVVEVIDQAEAKGDKETAANLRETLNNKSVAAAAKAAAKAAAGENSGESVVLDELKRSIPKHLTQKHEAAARIKSAASKLDAVKREVKELVDLAGGVFIPLQKIEIALKDTKSLIAQSRYWTECPRCKGKPKSDCDRCDGHGFLPFSRKGTLSDDDKKWLGVA